MSVPTIIPFVAAGLLLLTLVFPAGRSALAHLVRQRTFVAGTIVLTIGALTLNGSTQWLKLHFKKQSAALRVQSLTDPTDGIPAQLGIWMQATADQPIDQELADALKTRDYITRLYVNTAVIGKDETDTLRTESESNRQKHLVRLRQDFPPETFITLLITYNTGLVDTVTHIPDRCYVASGYEPSSYEVKYATCGKFPDGTARNISYRLIDFQDQSGEGRVGCRVGYLFQVDGKYENSPYAVRTALQNLFERYGYYAKVEMMTTEPLRDSTATDAESTSATVNAMNSLLTAVLPNLERCLPDWKKLHQH